jgi:hypothetical protein
MRIFTSTKTAIIAVWARFMSLMRSDVRKTEARFAVIEQRLTNEIATLRRELEQARTDAANEIRRIDTDIESHLEAVKYLDSFKRDSAGLRISGKPPVLR